MATFGDYDLDDLARMGQSKKLKEHHTELGDQASSILERANHIFSRYLAQVFFTVKFLRTILL